MQNFTDIPSSQTLADSLDDILNNDKTAISASSGTAFPTTNLQLGMPCYRTDEQKLYRLTAVSPSVVWTLEIDFSSGVAVAPQAAQSDGNFTTPLAIEVNSSSDGLRVTQTGSGNAFVVEDSANPDSTSFVIDATGAVINGATSSKSTRISSSSITPAIQQVGATNNNSNIGVFGFNTNPGLLVAKANGTEASPTPVASGNYLARISAAGFDGTNYTEGGSIRLEVDGTPATNSMPGRLVFSTTADGNSATTERMRIDSAGKVGIGTSSPTNALQIVGTAKASSQLYVGSNIDDNYSGGIQNLSNSSRSISIQSDPTNSGANSILTFGVDGTECMRIDSSGRVTMPYQPAFYAGKSNGDWTGTCLFNDVRVNNGGHYSAATGRFTAPVAGRYVIAVNSLAAINNSTGHKFFAVRRNGANIANVYTYVRSGEHAIMTSSFVYELAAGDYIDVTGQDGAFYGASTLNTNFSAYLLG